LFSESYAHEYKFSFLRVQAEEILGHPRVDLLEYTKEMIYGPGEAVLREGDE